MSKKIGHDYSRDPYPWDETKKHASSAKWTCCNMNLPSTYYTCPICETDRKLDVTNLLTEDLI
jgi:hypothetical protein